MTRSKLGKSTASVMLSESTILKAKNPAANADDNLWYARNGMHMFCQLWKGGGDVFYDYSLAGLQHLLSFRELVN